MPFQKICLCISFLIFTSISVAQNIFILERPGTIKNHKYYQNDQIKLKTISHDTIFSGVITMINDSSVVIDYANEIFLYDISYMYRKRWGFSLLQKLSLIAGASYLLISTTNGLINNDSPVVPKETLIISASLLAGGVALIPLTTRRYRIDNEKWRIKILDLTD